VHQAPLPPPSPPATVAPNVVVPLALLANPPVATVPMPVAAPTPVAKEAAAPAADRAALNRAVAELEAIRRELLSLAAG
jgi:hypothetical protein